MFQVDNYRVEFKHDQSDYTRRERIEIGIGGSFTDCTISHIDSGDNVVIDAFGYSTCHPKDQYNKNTGRKVALAKALKNFTGDRKLRKRFWDAYFRARNGKK